MSVPPLLLGFMCSSPASSLVSAPPLESVQPIWVSLSIWVFSAFWLPFEFLPLGLTCIKFLINLFSWTETCGSSVSYVSTASPTLCVLSQRSNSNIPTIEMSQGLFREVGVIEGQLSLTCINIQTKDIKTE